MNRFSIIIAVLLLFSTFSKAQITAQRGNKTKLITYTGKIVDAETGEPLPFSQINHIYKFIDKDKYEEVIEVEGFGRSKKSDVDKGCFVIKLKPRSTIRYLIRLKNLYENTPTEFNRVSDRRIVYVAKTEEEKKMLQEELDKKRKLQKNPMKTADGALLPVDVR